MFKNGFRALGFSGEHIKWFETELIRAHDVFIDLLKRIGFPVKKKPVKPIYSGLNSHKKLERALVMTEDGIRPDAVAARGFGEGKIAENATKVYEILLTSGPSTRIQQRISEEHDNIYNKVLQHRVYAII